MDVSRLNKTRHTQKPTRPVVSLFMVRNTNKTKEVISQRRGGGDRSKIR